MDMSNVSPEVGAAIVNLGSSLSTLVLKGTATAIHGKIESIKQEKSVDVVRNTYNEIVNQLLEEREDAVRIAQTYKQELEKVVISDEDIEYLQETISKVLDIISMFTPNDNDNEKAKSNIETMKSLKDLISKDVLKTMQLLGFNYKAAIGEPLTQLCANAISKLGTSSKTQNNSKQNNRR